MDIPRFNIKPTAIANEEIDDNKALFETLIRFYREQAENDISFCYRGPFIERFTNTILDISSGAMAPLQMMPMVNRKLSYLLVECFQNILRHGESHQGSAPEIRDDGLFGFRKIDDHFVINSINLFLQNEAPRLKELVDNVNQLDDVKLKELQLQQLRLSQLSEKGGAGLGLIEISRRSGQPLLYEIEDLGTELSCFHQQVSVATGEIKGTSENLIGETKRNYKLMMDEDIFLYYKGDFSQKSILPMLDIVEHNLEEDINLNKNGRKAGHVLIELLQNVSRHGGTRPNGSKEGIFLVGKKEDHTFIQVANIVPPTAVPFIEEKMNYLRSLSNEELKQLHKTALKASLKFENKHKSGLGLIEVAQASTSPLKFIFEPLEDGLLLFSMYVRI